MRLVYVFGEVQATKMPTSAASSSAHSNVTPCWSDENSNVAVVDSDGSVGVESRIVSGKAETVHWRVAGDESAPPAMFTARTDSVYVPGSATLTSYGETQSSYSAPSSEHSNVAVCSSLENVNVPTSDHVGCSGPESIVVLGATTVQLCTAGTGSSVPASLFARTFSSCAPSARPSNSSVDSHEPHVPPSSEHSNVASSSVDEKRNSATVLRVDAAGPETIVVFGATTVQLWLAGVVSTMPDVLVAATRSS